jgi:glutamate N-acetyltransferase/amino-acid N-acetyltransferase
MAVGLSKPEGILPVVGVKLAACVAGLYKKPRMDLAILSLEEGSTCAAVFTNNHFSAAPVQVARKHLRESVPRFCIINAGNANAGTGERGWHDALEVCRGLADVAGCQPASILPFSTGVIGEFLPVDRVMNKIPELFQALAADKWLDVANAMMTTDTMPKAVSQRVVIDGREVTITGIAKGSGMIKPDMATMLAFIATDLTLDQDALNQILKKAVDKSFNRISVDGDTSTNDACVLMATGRSGCRIDRNGGDRYLFEQAVTDVCSRLARAIVRDGEGATKFITIEVSEGRNPEECLQIAFAIANSPLIKTAFFASDPNWGRILAAIGRAGVADLDISTVSVYLDNVCVVERGMRSPTYTENAGRMIMQRDEFMLRVVLGRGRSLETVWTCDLSHEYVRINAEYRS